MVKVSDHASKRLRERMGANKKSVERIVTIAHSKGKSRKDFKGRMGRYLDGLYLKYRKGNGIRVYGDIVYIFQGRTLITVFHIPKGLKKYVSR